jgi:hypothetical protein
MSNRRRFARNRTIISGNQTLCAFDAADACGQFRAQKAGIEGFIGESPYGG